MLNNNCYCCGGRRKFLPLLNRLSPKTHYHLLKYYREEDINFMFYVLEIDGLNISKMMFLEAIEEFERRRIPRIAEFPGWLKVRKYGKGNKFNN